MSAPDYQRYEAEVAQFTNADTLKVQADQAGDGEKRVAHDLVHLIQRGGSMSFQFSMTPDQARELGMHLCLAADAVEQVE